MAEGRPAVAVEDVEPVAALFEPVAAARERSDPAGCVGDAETAGHEQVVQGEQPVQEGPQRVSRPWRVVVGLRLAVVVVGDAHDRRADLGRRQGPAEWHEAVPLDLGDRPEGEVGGTVDLEDGLQHDQPGSVRHAPPGPHPNSGDATAHPRVPHPTNPQTAVSPRCMPKPRRVPPVVRHD